MKCENCDKEHDGTFATGRFCNQSCSSSFSTKNDTNKTKRLNCIECGKEMVVGKRSGFDVKCIECRKINLICKTCGNEFFVLYKSRIRSFCSTECVKNNKEYKIDRRNDAKKRKFGGHTSKNRIYYKMKNGDVVYLQSSYEIKVAEELDLNDIRWERPLPYFYNDKESEQRRYYPDFYLNDFDVYLDPKNDYLIEIHKDKIRRVEEQNKISIIILDKNNLSWNRIKVKIDETVP